MGCSLIDVEIRACRSCSARQAAKSRAALGGTVESTKRRSIALSRRLAPNRDVTWNCC